MMLVDQDNFYQFNMKFKWNQVLLNKIVFSIYLILWYKYFLKLFFIENFPSPLIYHKKNKRN
jgi:hypothetical protein